MAHLGFNPQAVEPPTPTGLLPKGRYIVICDKSEVKPTKKGTGHVLLLQFVVQEGEYKKKRLFDYINIQNENPIAQRIGQQHLAAFCHAVGITQLDNSYQLHGIPVEVDVSIQDGKDGWEPKNVVKGFVKKATVADTGVNLSAQATVASVVPTPVKAYEPPVKSNLSTMDDDIPF